LFGTRIIVQVAEEIGGHSLHSSMGILKLIFVGLEILQSSPVG
jgi:hypothetical protein